MHNLGIEQDFFLHCFSSILYFHRPPARHVLGQLKLFPSEEFPCRAECKSCSPVAHSLSGDIIIGLCVLLDHLHSFKSMTPSTRPKCPQRGHILPSEWSATITPGLSLLPLFVSHRGDSQPVRKGPMGADPGCSQSSQTQRQAGWVLLQ